MGSRYRMIGWAALAMVVGLASARAEEERDKSYFQREIESWSSVIAELQEVDTTKASSQEVERIRNLIGQAQAFLAAEKLEEISPLLERGASLAALVRARSERIAVEQQAAAAEAAAETAEAAASEARQAAQAAQTKYDELEAKGL